MPYANPDRQREANETAQRRRRQRLAAAVAERDRYATALRLIAQAPDNASEIAQMALAAKQES